MNNINKLTRLCRIVYSAEYCTFKCVSEELYGRNILSLPYSHNRVGIMSQKSITSFFKVTPAKPKTQHTNKEAEDETEKSPISNGKEKPQSKRQRLISSDSETESPKAPKDTPPAGSDKKKKAKRQRIESSDSEAGSPVKSDSEPVFKVEKTSPKTYESPQRKKSKVKQEKAVLSENNTEDAKSPENKLTKKSSPIKKDNLKEEKSPSVVKKTDNEEKAEQENGENEEVAEKVSVAGVQYSPGKARYHPVRDACWAPGEPVPYLALARTLQAVEGTSARTRCVELLANYLRSVIALTPEDLLPSIYMCLNQLAPAYHNLELGVAETYLLKAVGGSTGRSVAQVRAAAAAAGELGLAAQRARHAQRTLHRPRALTLRHVLQQLRDVARCTGHASVNKKIAKIQALYVACQDCEAKFLIRSLEGKLRVGLAEQSVLQALALAAAATQPPVLDAARELTPELFKARVEQYALSIKSTYCECPDYERLVPALLQHGAPALPLHCRLTPGVPLKPMLAHPTKGVHEVLNRFEGEQFTCEWKYDGERAQIHVPGDDAPDYGKAAIFSRNQENNTSKYPDILSRLPSLLKESVKSCVLDCEAVAYDTVNKQILPFQILSTRKRKEAAASEIKVQVCVFLFDLLYLNGQSLVREPFLRRRELLHQHFREVEGCWQFARSSDCSSVEEVQQFLEAAVRASCEGLMVKMLQGENSRYDIARRSHNWLKLKKDYLEGVGDTIDVVVLGGYYGRGKRSGVFGGFLVACHDPAADEFQSLCKLGTGFSDQDLQRLSDRLREHQLPDGPHAYYRFDRCVSPDVWFSARFVWEVRCADLTLSPAHRAAAGLLHPDKGVSLRFPRFVREREDKTPEQATSAQQIADMYLAQDQVKNQAPPTRGLDDFY